MTIHAAIMAFCRSCIDSDNHGIMVSFKPPYDATAAMRAHNVRVWWDRNQITTDGIPTHHIVRHHAKRKTNGSYKLLRVSLEPWADWEARCATFCQS